VPDKKEKKEEKTTEQLALTVDKQLFDQLHALARLEGVDVYNMATEILGQYVDENEYKLDSQLNPIDAADKADKLFAQAVKLQSIVAASGVGTKERVRAEADFINTLQKAAALFAEITKNLKGTDIEKHIQLRMNQITALCDSQLEEEKSVPQNEQDRPGS
jgi:hypothetical protein